MDNIIYISGYFNKEDEQFLNATSKELNDYGYSLCVRNLSGAIMQAAFDYADFEFIAISYEVLQQFFINGGYDLVKILLLKLWKMICKERSSRT